MNTQATLDPGSAEAPAGLLAVIQELSGMYELEAVTHAVAGAARLLTGADGATFVLRDGDLVHYVDEDAIGPLWKGRRFPAERCISGWAILHRRHAVIPDIYADPRIPADAYRPTFVKSLAVVPIRANDPLGAIGIYWASIHEATPEELAQLQALANATAIAIVNVELYGTLMRTTLEVEQARALADALGQRLQLALAAAEIGLWDHDPRTGEVQCDARCRELLGITSEGSLVLQDLLDRIFADDRWKVLAAIEGARDPGSDNDLDVEFRTLAAAADPMRWVRITGRAIRRDGRTLHLPGTMQDVTRRHREDEGREGAPVPAVVVSPASHPRRLLIVDDNADAAEMLADFLAAVGWVVRIAADGPAALKLLDRFEPEVALLDIGLPIMDGYALADKIREVLGARAPRLIAVTGYGQDSDRDRSRARGFDVHLVKPVDPMVLLGVLRDS